MRPAGLDGRRAARLEAHFADAASALIERMGALPMSAQVPRGRTRRPATEVAHLIDALAQGEVGVVVVLTSLAVTQLFRQAHMLGRLGSLTQSLARVTLVARGPKAATALTRVGLCPTLTVAHPFTTREVIAALARAEVAGAGVAILHYGELSRPLASAMARRGARVLDVHLREWRSAGNAGPLERLVETIIQDRFEAVRPRIRAAASLSPRRRQ